MNATPILFLGDSPSLMTGLARIGRDLASLLCRRPEYRVGYFGMGGLGTRHAPFPQYNYPFDPEWGSNYLQQAWRDFADDRQGIIFSIWDATRLHWFSRPTAALPLSLRNFLTSRRFSRWIYSPIDATGPSNVLSRTARESLAGFDRVLAYTIWGSEVIGRSLGRPVDWIPHGYNGDTWQPRDRKVARMVMGFQDRDIVIGINAANQPRKDFGCAFTVFSLLRDWNPNVQFWVHTDELERSHAWSIPNLVADYGLTDRVKVTLTGDLADIAMSYYYSGCDLTILPSAEGFGYPLVESMACGTPVVHGNYAGGAELIPTKEWLIEPCAWRLEGLHNSLRPVWDPATWYERVRFLLECKDRAAMRTVAVDAVEHLRWAQLWPSVWQKWFLEAL